MNQNEINDDTGNDMNENRHYSYQIFCNKCPNCNSREIQTKIATDDNGPLKTPYKIRQKKSPLYYYIICRNCGKILAKLPFDT